MKGLRQAGGKKVLTRASLLKTRLIPPSRQRWRDEPKAKGEWIVSRVAKGLAHRRGRPGFSRGKMQAGDCILRLWEGTDFCRGGLSVLAKIWAWETHPDTFFLTAGPPRYV